MPTRRRFTDAERAVWNRACYGEGTSLRDGDLALAAMIRVDGWIQNGGVGHAFDLAPDQLAEGLAGYRYFGLDELASIIKPHSGEEEADYNRRYYQFTGRDNLIIAKFQEMFSKHPERFAPVGNPEAG